MKNASIHLGAFLENFWKFVSPTIYFPSSNSTSDFLCRLNILKKTDTGFETVRSALQSHGPSGLHVG
jgi:hypothetical protein